MINESDHLKQYLADYLQRQGINLSKNFFCLNPEHQDKHTPSMAYWKDHDKVRCFGACNRSFDIYDIVGFEHGTSNFLEQLEIVKNLYGGGGGFTSANENKRKLEPPEPPPDFSALYPVYHSHLAETSYFTGRGISQEIQERYKLGYDPEARAVVIPISSSYYLTRKTTEKAYRNYGSVYPLNLEALSQDKPVFIAESAIDALSIIELGFPAIALNGTPHRKPLLKALENYSRLPLLIIAFDNDEPGKKAALELSQELEAINASYILPKFPDWYEDSNQALKLHKEAYMELLSEISNMKPITIKPKQGETMPDKKQIPEPEPKITAKAAQVSNYLNLFFTGDYKDIYTPTGFPKLDELLYDGLREGLYMLGAVSSMGKTTFCLQMAHQIAEQGHSVLYLALEQGREEILAKSYSMLTYSDIEGHYPSTAREIRRYSLLPAYNKQEIDKAKVRLAKYAERLFIYEDFPRSFESLVFEHQIETGSVPEVIFIDYLQIMPKPQSLSGGASDKQIVDANVNMLRRMARKYHNSIVALSILSRYFYSKPLTLQSFKESGGIEAGADYLLGIQPKGIEATAEGKTFDFQSLYKAEKRDLELVILKARNGIPGEVPLRYYAKFNYFEELD
jgi:replicative DNA helicase